MTKLDFRGQYDGLEDIQSDLAGIRFDDPDNKDMTRQEQGPATDINKLVATFGVESLNPRQAIFTETDYTQTLQDTLNFLQNVNEIWATLPQEIRDKYPTRKAVAIAIENGDLERALQNLSATPGTPPGDQPAGTDTPPPA